MRIPVQMLIAIVSLMSSAVAAAQAVPANTSAPKSSGASTGASGPLQEVTVIARRLKLESKITNFVYGITTLENYEGLARWTKPLCPLVTGLTQQQGEFVLERVSEIARTAGAPLAGEQCRPNLFVFVTNQPKELLQAMESRYFAVAFGNARPSEVEDFINTPHAVRVWHSPYWTPVVGTPLAHGLPPSAQLLGGGLAGAPTYTNAGAMGASRLVAQGVWTFGNVYVIVDATQLHGVSQGQFADYIAMVSLAQIKPAAHLGDTQSILRLFAGTPQAAPAGMSAWDSAFLKALYQTAHDSKIQRSLITHSMANDLSP
jgi:hypothetical protein